ncbi:hypothetical protein, partial [Haliscomenobacter sp.]|uniref:hypothetical protein n=1 Tax=Haliscomenobacter sp. TaxID=2717303 RepID=UPI003365022B
SRLRRDGTKSPRNSFGLNQFWVLNPSCLKSFAAGKAKSVLIRPNPRHPFSHPVTFSKKRRSLKKPAVLKRRARRGYKK